MVHGTDGHPLRPRPTMIAAGFVGTERAQSANVPDQWIGTAVGGLIGISSALKMGCNCRKASYEPRVGEVRSSTGTDRNPNGAGSRGAALLWASRRLWGRFFLLVATNFGGYNQTGPVVGLGCGYGYRYPGRRRA
jgi:hypothetical protein